VTDVVQGLDAGMNILTPLSSPAHSTWLSVLTDPVRLRLLHVLCQFDSGTSVEIARNSDCSLRTTRRHLRDMHALGLIWEEMEPSAEGAGRPAKRFGLYPRAREQALALFELINKPFGPWQRQSGGLPPAR
jgi:hypothetical protein